MGFSTLFATAASRRSPSRTRPTRIARRTSRGRPRSYRPAGMAGSGGARECPVVGGDLLRPGRTDRMPSWHKGDGVALVGDACSAVSLLAGQGASLAVAGAYLLADQLHVAPTIDRALAEYGAALASRGRGEAEDRSRCRALVPAGVRANGSCGSAGPHDCNWRGLPVINRCRRERCLAGKSTGTHPESPRGEFAAAKGRSETGGLSRTLGNPPTGCRRLLFQAEPSSPTTSLVPSCHDSAYPPGGSYESTARSKRSSAARASASASFSSARLQGNLRARAGERREAPPGAAAAAGPVVRFPVVAGWRHHHPGRWRRGPSQGRILDRAPRPGWVHSRPGRRRQRGVPGHSPAPAKVAGTSSWPARSKSARCKGVPHRARPIGNRKCQQITEMDPVGPLQQCPFGRYRVSEIIEFWICCGPWVNVSVGSRSTVKLP